MDRDGCSLEADLEAKGKGKKLQVEGAWTKQDESTETIRPSSAIEPTVSKTKMKAENNEEAFNE